MSDLITLTDEQKEGLSEGDQALIRLGVKDSSLKFINRKFITETLFKMNKAKIEQAAIARVRELEAKEMV